MALPPGEAGQPHTDIRLCSLSGGGEGTLQLLLPAGLSAQSIRASGASGAAPVGLGGDSRGPTPHVLFFKAEAQSPFPLCKSHSGQGKGEIPQEGLSHRQGSAALGPRAGSASRTFLGSQVQREPFLWTGSPVCSGHVPSHSNLVFRDRLSLSSPECRAVSVSM